MASRDYSADDAISKFGCGVRVFCGCAELHYVVSVNFSEGYAEISARDNEGNCIIDNQSGDFVNAVVVGNVTIRPDNLSGGYSVNALQDVVGPVDVFCNGTLVKNVKYIDFDENFIQVMDAFSNGAFEQHVRFNGFITVRPIDGE